MMKVQSSSETRYTVTIECSEEERYKLANAVKLIQKMLPSPDDGLSMLTSMLSGRPTYSPVDAEAELGDLLA